MRDRKDVIKAGYQKHAGKYDDYITSGKLWSKLAVKLLWGMKDADYVDTILPLLSDDFCGKLLDIPTGTAVFTYKKYQRMKNAAIVCLDYSKEMLEQAENRFASLCCDNVQCLQGDVENLPFASGFFDTVLSMNGFHAFPDKERAFDEVFRVLKPKGRFLGCFYINGERKLTDWFVKRVFFPGGTFTPPFMRKDEVDSVLQKRCAGVRMWTVNSIVCFEAEKR